MKHLAEVVIKANWTFQRILNHKKKYSDADFAEMIDSYIITVHGVTDLEAVRDVTIHQRRSEILFEPIMHSMRLISKLEED